MFQFFSNMPIFRRLFISFALATVLPGIVIVALGFFYLQSLSVRSAAVKVSFDAKDQATQQQVGLQRMNALLQARFGEVFATNNTLFANDPSFGASSASVEVEIASIQTEFDHGLSVYQEKYQISTSPTMSSIRAILLNDNHDANQRVITDQQNALNDVMQHQWNDYRDAQQKVIDTLAMDLTGNMSYATYQNAYMQLFDANAKYTTVKNTWQRVLDDTSTLGTTVTAVGNSLILPLVFATAAAILFTLLIIVATGFLVNATIVNPLNQLVGLSKRIAEGETNARSHLSGRDEISLVATSINGMLDHIVRLVQQSQTRHANLQAQIEKLVNEVSGIGEGDLRIQAEVTTDELGVLADSFNFMAEELSNLVVNVKTLAREVQDAGAQAFHDMAQLAQSADGQLTQMSQATVEVSNVASASQQVAERAQVLYNVASQARETALSGRAAVRQTAEGMEHINDNVHATSARVISLEERSREINNIVKVISSIAHQTNRLALDAAIQAAMAGENGKGFGAVSVDIRRLSERAKEQATMIGQIVRGLLDDISTATLSMRETEQQTTSGTQLARQVGIAFESIFAVVEHQASEIDAINQLAMQQLQTSSTVVDIMQNVSQVTQRSSSSTHDVAQEMERLSRLAGQLLASVDVFKLRADRAQQVTVTEGRSTQEQLVFSGSQRALAAPAGTQSAPPDFERTFGQLQQPFFGASNLAKADNGVEAYPAFASPQNLAASTATPYVANQGSEWSGTPFTSFPQPQHIGTPSVPTTPFPTGQQNFQPAPQSNKREEAREQQQDFPPSHGNGNANRRGW